MLVSLPASLPDELAAQQDGWNSPRALDLVERAREVRHAASVDSLLRSYQADARGYVYFFIDRPDAEERTLVKADQIALEVYWRAPDQTKQRIVGLRDEKLLPTDIKYHLDHLTVVQDDFGDRIRLGDGDEVSDVMHPIAPESGAIYDFRLADSLTLSFAGTTEAVRVYEVQVRPEDPDRPGIVGSVFLDRSTSAIVRMSFTFTPASYVDPYLDYIRISLDNSLWMGRYWLPYRQEAELRRELPQLDFLAGSVIRGRFEIGDYRFNKELPEGLFRTRRVSALPEARRRAFPFEDSLFAHLEEEGLETPPTLREVRERAREMVADRYLSGLSRLRLHLPSASSAYRYGRAEGSFVGVGTTLRPGGGLALKTHAGYAFERERPAATLRLEPAEREGSSWAVALYGNRPRDVGPFEPSARVTNTLAGLLADTDWQDPYFASGGRVLARGAGSGSRSSGPRWLLGGVPGVDVRWEHHASATDVVSDGDDDFRPVRPVDEGALVSVGTRLDWAGGVAPEDGPGLRLRATALHFDGDVFIRTGLTAAWAREATWRDLDVSVRLDAARVASAAPPQNLFLLGGRETLLGHPYRAFVGNAFWLLRAEASRELAGPWLSLRLFASAGQADFTGERLPVGWRDLDPSTPPLFSVGAGVGLLWNVLRLDLGRGLDGGDWSLAFSVTPRFREWL